TLDESLARLEAQGAAPGAQGSAREPGDTVERIAYRVKIAAGGALDVEPLLQKQVRGEGFSRGARLQWFHLPERRDLTAADRRAHQAYDDRFARGSNTWGGALTPAQVFGILRALCDPPAVFLDGERDGVRLDIRQGRVRLRFSTTAADGSLSPYFELP